MEQDRLVNDVRHLLKTRSPVTVEELIISLTMRYTLSIRPGTQIRRILRPIIDSGDAEERGGQIYWKKNQN